MENQNNISAVIITFNEEKNIERCLNSLKDVADEIVVIDSFSTDKTKEICLKHNVKFIENSFEGHIQQKNFAKDQATYDYVLSLDADEALSKGLKKQILEEKQDLKYDGYSFKRLNNYCGKFIKHSGWYPDRKLRLWNRKKGKWGGKNPHDKFILNEGCSIKKINEDLLHYTFYNYDEHLIQTRKFSVHKNHAKEFKLNLFLSIIKAKAKFLHTYILNRGFLDGNAGFKIALTKSLSILTQYAENKKEKNKNSEIKNICFSNTTSFWGGGEKWHYSASSYFNDRGFTVSAIANTKSELGKKLLSKSIIVKNIKNSSLSFLNIIKIKKQMNFFKKNKVQHLIINGPADLKSSGIAAWLAGVPDIIYRRGIAKKPSRGFLNKLLFLVIVDRFITNSNDTFSNLIANLDIDASKIKNKVIYNGVSIKEVSDKANENKVFTIGNLARLTKQKGHHHLIKIAKELKNSADFDFKIIIGGIGEEEENIKANIKKENLEKNIELIGFVNDVQKFMSETDLFVSTSEYEGFGYVIAEAMMEKKAVVAFDISSNPEIIQNNKTGFLIKPFEHADFAKAIIELHNNKALRNEMELNARKKLEKEFDFKNQLKKVEDYVFGKQ